MKILMQCQYFPPEVGGLESHVHTLCRELVRRGHHVTMITSRSRPGLPRREAMDGVAVRRVWMPWRSPAGWIAHALATTPTHYALAGAADVLHAQDFAAVPPAWPARRRYRRPLVLTLHTSHFLVRARRPVWRPILRRIIASADYVLAASRELLHTGLALYPHPRAEALLNAVDTERFHPRSGGAPPPPPRRVIVPRRLVTKNGVEHFIRALPRIAAALGDVEAVVVGDGPERQGLESLAANLGVAGRIRFLGARPHAEMPEILAAAALAIVPSLIEASSVAALEAMACGVPVAASRVGGMPEIVDESVGALFAPADPAALADAVIGLLRDAPALVRRGATARHRVVERFDLSRLVDRHVEIYEGLRREARG